MQEPSLNTTQPTRRWSQSQLKSTMTVSWHLALFWGWRIKRQYRRCSMKSRAIRFKLTWIVAYYLASGSMKKKLNRPLFRPLLIKSIVASFKVLNSQVATYPRECLHKSMIIKLFKVKSKHRMHHCPRCRRWGTSPSLSAILPHSLNMRSSYAKSIQTRTTKYIDLG